jgi:hypothetical protein
MSTTGDALPDDAEQATSSGVPIPLRERRRDWFFIIMFALFATTSFLIDKPTWLAAQARTQATRRSCVRKMRLYRRLKGAVFQ